MTHPRFTVTDMHRFRADFLTAARSVAKAMPSFSSDDVWMALPGWELRDWAPDSGTVGSLMQALKHERLAMPTDRVIKSTRPASKGRAIRVWRSTVSEAEALVAKGQAVLL